MPKRYLRELRERAVRLVVSAGNLRGSTAAWPKLDWADPTVLAAWPGCSPTT